ncbi:MAG: hypothetical protein ACIARQ_08220 [Phycisphaerales bacterium JB061]
MTNRVHFGKDEGEMDRISFTQQTQGLQQQMPVREPKLIDPSARLKIADRKDSVEFSSLTTKAAAAQSMERLVAARVTTPVDGVPAAPANPVGAGSAIRFYTNPTDQNAAATLGAGSKLDVLA